MATQIPTPEQRPEIPVPAPPDGEPGGPGQTPEDPVPHAPPRPDGPPPVGDPIPGEGGPLPTPQA